MTSREAIKRARRSRKFSAWQRVSRRVLFFDGAPLTAAGERHHTPAEVAKLWALSVETIRRLFENEPGVLKVSNATGYTGRRRYKTLRIPVSVMNRLHRRISA
jgi:hypothetical protein